MTWGTNALLLAAIPVYLMVGLCLPDVKEQAPLREGASGSAD